MANQNKPFGLAFTRSISGTTGEQTTRYYIPSTDNNAYYIGDAVISAAVGDALGTPGCNKATSGTEVLRGVIAGVEPVNQLQASLVGSTLQLEQTSIPATKSHAYYAYVIDDPAAVFTIQGDGTATNQVATNSNKNFSLTIAAGATVQSLSGTVLNSASLNTTNSLNMKAMGLRQTPPDFTNGYSAYAVWNCRINLHELSAAGTTAI